MTHSKIRFYEATGAHRYFVYRAIVKIRSKCEIIRYRVTKMTLMNDGKNKGMNQSFWYFFYAKERFIVA